jgi:hypothetical protein
MEFRRLARTRVRSSGVPRHDRDIRPDKAWHDASGFIKELPTKRSFKGFVPDCA